MSEVSSSALLRLESLFIPIDSYASFLCQHLDRLEIAVIRRMEALIDEFALSPPATEELYQKEDEPFFSTRQKQQTAGQSESEVSPTPTPALETGRSTDLLDEVADMNIPKTINADMTSFDDDNRADQVVSPDGSNFDGTSTIGSAASEPTTETGISRGKSVNKRTTARGGSRGGNSKSGNSRTGTSRSNSSRGGGSRSGANPAAPSTPRRSYRNSYSSGNNRMNQSTVPRPFKRPGPLSYSKAVRLGGSGMPYGGREMDDKTRAVMADMNEFDSAQLETQ